MYAYSILPHTKFAFPRRVSKHYNYITIFAVVYIKEDLSYVIKIQLDFRTIK